MEENELYIIPTKEAEINLDNLLKDKKTVFLNGTWGSGKSRLIENMKKRSTKDFIEINLWRKTDDKSVIEIFHNSLRPCKQIFYSLMNHSIPVNITILGLLIPFIYRTKTSIYIKILVTLVYGGFLLWQTNISNNYFNKLYKSISKDDYKNKVLIIDDFDRLPESVQEDCYTVFNNLHGRLPILFVGDLNKIAKNDSNYLNKIIDISCDLPYALLPKQIWNDYFNSLFKKFDKPVNAELIDLFINTNRNIRDQVQFNNYVNMILIETSRYDHVQIDQQLLMIYLFLFEKNYYNNLFKGWFPGQNEMKESNLLINIIIKILTEKDEPYPPSFPDIKEYYYIFESINNLSLSNAEAILKSNDDLIHHIIEDDFDSDFHKFLVSKYKQWDLFDHNDIHIDKRTEPKNIKDLNHLENICFSVFKKYSKSFYPIQRYVFQQYKLKWKFYNNYSSEDKQTEFIVKKIDSEFFSDDIDISQKIFFISELLNYKYFTLKISHFKKEIDACLNDGIQFSKQKKKPYLLIPEMYAIDQFNDEHRLRSVDIAPSIFIYINNLDDNDFIRFLTFLNIIDVNFKMYTSISDFEFHDINSIHLNEREEDPYDDTRYIDYSVIYFDFYTWKSRVKNITDNNGITFNCV